MLTSGITFCSKFAGADGVDNGTIIGVDATALVDAIVVNKQSLLVVFCRTFVGTVGASVFCRFEKAPFFAAYLGCSSFPDSLVTYFLLKAQGTVGMAPFFSCRFLHPLPFRPNWAINAGPASKLSGLKWSEQRRLFICKPGQVGFAERT